MTEYESGHGPNPMRVWIAYPDQIPTLVKALLAHDFQKLEPTPEAAKNWKEDYLWYYDDHGNCVTIDSAAKKGERIVNCSRGALPIVSDTFAGLDCFRQATDEDY